VVELADTRSLRVRVLRGVGVRVPPPAPYNLGVNVKNKDFAYEFRKAIKETLEKRTKKAWWELGKLMCHDAICNTYKNRDWNCTECSLGFSEDKLPMPSDTGDYPCMAVQFIGLKAWEGVLEEDDDGGGDWTFPSRPDKDFNKRLPLLIIFFTQLSAKWDAEKVERRRKKADVIQP
jgi:hypothetical protein